jgi:hypothetical protein
LVSAWSGGYQAEVSVTDSGSVPLSAWTVAWSQPSGQTIVNLWNGVQGSSGSQTTAHNAPYNGQVGVGASTTFGYVVNGSGSAPTSLDLTCQPS